MLKKLLIVTLLIGFNSLSNSTKAQTSTETITIQKAPFYLHMIELEDDGFVETLRKKLLWGADPRN